MMPQDRQLTHAERSHGEFSLREAQGAVDAWIQNIGVRYFCELTNLAQLMEEVGELARIVSRTYGEQSFKESDKRGNLSEELADVLFVLICLANQTGVDLTAALKANLAKKSERDADRHRNNAKLQATSDGLTNTETEGTGNNHPAE